MWGFGSTFFLGCTTIETQPVVTIACHGTRFTDIHAVFLDKDGTLADVASYLSQLGHAQAELMECQWPGTYELTLKILGLSPLGLSASGLLAVGSRQETIMASAAAAAIMGCPWVQAIELATATLTAADQQCAPKVTYTPLLPGALDFLKRLKQTPIKIIMVSADAQSNLEDFVQHYQLQAYFDKIQGVSTMHPLKTEPSFLPAICQAINISPRQGLVIGDAATDLRMAEITRGFIGFLGGWQPMLLREAILPKHGLRQPTIAYEFVTDFSQITVA